MKRPEQILQCKVATWCRNNLAPDVIFWATNNNASHARSGERNKAMGVLAGVPDLMFSYRDKMYFLELKHNTKVSIEQANFLDKMALRGHYTAVAWGYDDAIRIVKEWELPLLKKEKPDEAAFGF